MSQTARLVPWMYSCLYTMDFQHFGLFLFADSWSIEGQPTISKSRYPPRHNELGQRERGGLNSCADHHDDTPYQDGHLPAKDITQPDGGNRAKKASERVSAHGDALHIRGFRLGPTRGRVLSVNLGEVMEERGQCQQTTQHTLDLLLAVLCAGKAPS